MKSEKTYTWRALSYGVVFTLKTVDGKYEIWQKEDDVVLLTIHGHFRHTVVVVFSSIKMAFEFVKQLLPGRHETEIIDKYL